MASVLLRASGAALAFVINVALARMLGVTQFGRYMTLFSAAIVLGSLAQRGVDQLLTREFSATSSRISLAMSGLARWATGRVGLGLVICMATYSVWLSVAGVSSHSGVGWIDVVAGLGVLVAYAACGVLGGLLNGYGASLRSQSLTLVVRNFSVLILLGTLWLLSRGVHRADTVLVLQTTGFLVAAVMGAWWVSRLWSHDRVMSASNSTLVDPEIRRGWAVVARRFLLVTIAAVLINRIDVVLVAAVSGETTAGFYAAGARLAQVALMVAMAVNMVLSPRIAKAWGNGNFEAMRHFLATGFMFTVPISVFEILIAVFFSRNIVMFLGRDYAGSATVFLWVTVAYAVWSVTAPAYALLGMSGGERYVAGASWAILFFNIIGILSLVPMFGAKGAAIAMAAAYSVAVIPILMLSKSHILRKTKVRAAS